MPGLTPTRTEISDRFSVLGFRVHSGRNPYFEVAIATDPALFHADAKEQRSSSNFYSSRSAGPILAAHGETMYFIPPHVLRHFAGKERLYYTVATFGDTSRVNPEVLEVPDQARPWITISKSFTGKEIRRLIGAPSRTPSANGGNGYGAAGPGAFRWAGDDVVPGSSQKLEPAGRGIAAPASSPTPPRTTGASATPGPTNGKSSGSGTAGTATAIASEQGFEYDDGHDPSFWSSASAAPVAVEQPKRTTAKATASSPSTLLQPWTDVAWGDVQLVGDRDDVSSWIAAAAMIVGWRDQMSVDPGDIANKLGVSTDRQAIAKACKLDLIPGSGYGITELHDQIENFGPLWVAASSAQDPHAFVITCMCGDGTEDGTLVGIMDTWGQVSGSPRAAMQNGTPGQGSSYTITFRQLAAQYDPRMVPNPADATHVSFQLMRSRTTEGHQVRHSCGTSSQTQGVSMKRVKALDAGQSIDENWNEVELVAQPTNASCWATAGAMVYGWKNMVSIAPESIASLFGQDPNVGLAPKDRKALADVLGLVSAPPQCYSVDGFRQMLEDYGPLWVGIHTDDGWNHAVVATGMYGDGSPDGTFVRINDPWGRTPGTPAKPGSRNPTPGQASRYTLPFNEFMKEYEERMTTNGGVVNVQITHAPAMPGRQISSGSQAQSLGASPGSAPRQKKGQQKPVGKTLQAAVVVPVVTTIAGAVLTRVLSNEGDVKWELDQLKGLKHVRDDAKNAGSDPYYDAKITNRGPRITNHLIIVSDTIYADFEIAWQFNGHSLGNIMISNTQTSDTAAWGLEVKATINDDAKVYPTKTGSGECAGLQIRFYYRFTWSFGADHIYIRDFWLYGDGTFTKSGQWTQD